jgi:elongation factor G
VATKIENIRNIALVGHGGSGKTSFAEAILHKTGVTNRLGSVPDGSSMLDFTDEEKEKQCSVYSAVCHVEHDGMHVNIVDTAGGPDFLGQSFAALAAAETGVLVISATAGIEVVTRKMMERLSTYGVGKMIVITKIDGENTNLEALVTQIQESFGPECVPVNLPAGGGKFVVDCLKNDSGDSDFGDVGEAHTALIEAIVGADDQLMEKYLGGEVSDAEVMATAPTAVTQRVLVPIFFCDTRNGVGITEFLDALKIFAPSPLQGKKREMTIGEGENAVAKEVDPKGSDLVGQVFKVYSDPKSHIKYSFIRIHSGRLGADTQLHSTSERKAVRPGIPSQFQGGEHQDVSEATAGEIVALAKLELHTGDVVFEKEGGHIRMPRLPKPMYALAVEAKARGDEEKLGQALKKFVEEDPCFEIDRDSTTKELVIHGLGDVHLRTILSKIAHTQHVEVNTKPPKIPYRETITGRAENVEYTHKKQSGGSGQFGRVIINVLANERGAGYEFVDKIFGGAIDQQYRPSVDKGIKSQMAEGVLAGYPIIDVKVELVDGKTHPVDSKDIAFQIAGKGAFKDGFMKANPILLEPVVDLEVTCPADCVGDIQGDLASRRGRPQGQDMIPGGMAIITASVPLAEVADYASRLSSITGGQGSYAMELSHYDQVPGNVQQQIVAASQKKED